MSSLSDVLRGRAWKFGDAVDTNQLAGAGLQGATVQETLRINCLRSLRPEFTDGVQPGDFIVAGSRFACGSGRQTAIEALKLCGVAAVVAESIARISRRNCIALGIPAFSVPGVSALIEDGDELEIDYDERTLRNLSRGSEVSLPSLPPTVEAVYAAGGLDRVIRNRLAAKGIFPPAGEELGLR